MKKLVDAARMVSHYHRAMHDLDLDLDFAMLDLPTTGRCRAAEAPETDPVEATLVRAAEAAPFIAEATGVA